MAWIKVPVENHPLFHAALPKDPRISTIRMFGALAGLVNGNLFSGLFARSAIVKLGESDHAEAMKLDGSEPFDPMGTGRVMSNTVLLPETIMDEPTELRDWFRKAFEYALTLPPKKKKAKTVASTKAKRSEPSGRLGASFVTTKKTVGRPMASSAKVTASTKASGKPTKASAKPTKASAKPTKRSAEPTKASGKPTKASAKPTKRSAKPTKASGKPTKPTKPTKPSKPSKQSGKPNNTPPSPARAAVKSRAPSARSRPATRR